MLRLNVVCFTRRPCNLHQGPHTNLAPWHMPSPANNTRTRCLAADCDRRAIGYRRSLANSRRPPRPSTYHKSINENGKRLRLVL